MPRKPKRKRIFVGSDPHCGHIAGLTPPAYQLRATTKRTLSASKRNKFAQLEGETWNSFVRLIQKNGPYDAAFWLGDCIDGAGKRSGGTELIVPDREEQVEMFVCCSKVVGAPVQKLVYGTGYHTGDAEDWENLCAVRLKEHCKTVTIGSHEWVDVNGLIFDLKHHIGGSGIPHGRKTAIEREWLWSNLWADEGYTPRADVLLRGHVHYFGYGGGRNGLRMTLPALQAMGTKYGSRRCSGLVDWGFITFDVASVDDWTWEPHLVRIHSQITKADKI